MDAQAHKALTAATCSMPGPVPLLSSLILTWLIEWAVCAVVLQRINGRDGLAVLAINAVTQPLANAAFNLAYAPWLLVEVIVTAVEIPALRLLIVDRWGQAAFLSLAANTASAAIGYAASVPSPLEVF